MEREITKAEENSTKYMLEAPITDLSRLIGQKWYLSIGKLSEQSGVPSTTILKAVRGKAINPKYEAKLRQFLEGL